MGWQYQSISQRLCSSIPDGPKSDTGTGGAVFVFNLENIFKRDNRASIFRADLYAILKAVAT